MTITLLFGLVVGALVFVGLTWVTSELAWRRMNPLEQRELLMNEPVEKTGTEKLRDRLWSVADRSGLTSDLDRSLLQITAIYLGFLLVGSILGLDRVVVFVVALPAAVLTVIGRNRRQVEMREQHLRFQLLGVFESLAGLLEAGDTVPSAVSKLAGRVEEPLRSELVLLSNSHAAFNSLVPGLKDLHRRHPSRPLRLLTAAVEVDERHGVPLVPVLRHAGEMLERDQELAAEALAELSQARGEFIGISGIIGGIALLMLVGAAGIARDAYFTPVGLLAVGIGVGNYAFGVWRTLRTLKQAREVSV